MTLLVALAGLLVGLIMTSVIILRHGRAPTLTLPESKPTNNDAIEQIQTTAWQMVAAEHRVGAVQQEFELMARGERRT